MHRLPISIDRRDVMVGVDDPTATIGDVVTHIGSSITDARVSYSLLDARVRPGDELVAAEPTPPTSGWAVHVVAGLDAGRVIPVRVPPPPVGGDEPVGVEVRVGRGAEMDVRLRSNAVSSHHCTLTIVDGEVWVVDAGSRNGTVAGGELAPVDSSDTDATPRRFRRDATARTEAIEPLRVDYGDLIRCGPSVLTVRAVELPDTPVNMRRLLATTPTGPVPFYRSPIDHPPEPHGEIPLPPGPRDPKTGRPGLIGFLLPLLMAGGLVWFTGQWFYALFALMMPLMMLMTTLDRAGRNRRIRKSSKKRYQEEIDEFVDDVARASDHELRRRRLGLPDATEVVRRATTVGAALWTRRRDHPWYLAVGVGVGDVRWELPVAEVPDELRDLDDLVEEWKTLRDAPVEVRLQGTLVGLAGERSAALALARSMIVQLAALHGPADVRIAVVTSAERAADWDWVKWLPHVRPTFAGGRLLTVVADDEGRLDGGAIDDVLADVEGGIDLIAVIDTDRLHDAGDVAVKRLLRRDGSSMGPAAGGVVLAPTVDGLPDSTDVVIEHADSVGDAVVRHPRRPKDVQDCSIVGMGRSVATVVARRLAALSDPDTGGGSATLPARLGLLEVLGVDDAASAVSERWRAAESPRLIAGTSDHGAAVVDLAAHGPHVAVIGARGSGKTEQLTSMILGLAASQPPEQVHMVLWGESFGPLQRLPHVANTVSRVDEATLSMVLDGLDRELVRRERRRVAAEAASTGDAAAVSDPATNSGTADELPTLLVVIDDIDRLDRIVPTAGDDLLRMLRRARNVGVHVVFSANRHQGGSLNDLVDLTSTQMVLRVGSGPDSTDLIGSDAASRLERTLPGRGYLVAGRHDPVEVQSPVVTVGAPVPVERIEVHDFVIEAGRTGFATQAFGAPEQGRLLQAITAAGATSAHAPDLLSPTAESATVLDSPGLLEQLGIDGVAGLPDAVDRWIDTDSEALLRLPIGVDPDLRPVVLDLKESALNGMGPHGLLVGATGSGKSELLRTLVGGLALTHSPEVLSFVLVDFKGGASFANLGGLPHVAGVVTNLADDLALVDRILAALGGEQRRRQELLAAAGNLANVQEYRAARRAGKLPPELADQPLPDLVLVVDEFAELLDQEPEFIDFFLTIGRVGRSLGIHMLLASQRLEEGKLRGLDTYLSYRLGLRTFSAAESRIVLGSPDAYSLPQAPGGGYLKVGSTAFDRFQASYVSGPIPEAERSPDDDPERTVLDAIVEHLADAAPKVHQIWLPPLADDQPLDAVFGNGFVNDERRGFAAARWPRTGSLGVPIGTIDEPGQQRQIPLVLDFAGAHGNLAIAGAPQTGKSTALRSMILGLCVTHTATEVQLYGIDFGGGGLASLDALPHVGGVATRLEPDRVRRLLSHVETVLERREALFGRLDLDTMATVRRERLRRAAADRADERDELDEWFDRGELADVFLVIDGWAAFRERFEMLEPLIADLASRGLGYGVHVVVTLNRWMEMRANVLDAIGGRLELRLNSALDSMIDRKRAAVIRVEQPGRALHPSGLLCHVALPRLDGRASQEQLPGATKVAVDHVAERWSGPTAAAIRLLPTEVAFADLDLEHDVGSGAPRGVPVGIEEDELATWHLDLGAGDPHFFVYGDGESGKTTFLETFLHGLARTTSPDDAQFAVVDYRRTLLERIPESHLEHYAAAEPAAIEVIAAVAEIASSRLPGADVTASQLRERSWWTGPEWYVVVDDYDLVVTPSGNPLAPLLPLLAQGRDVGLHVIVARRVAGAAKMMYEPITARLREVSPTGIVMSGDREEGPILGSVRASEQPPGRGVVVSRRSAPKLVHAATVTEPAVTAGV